MGKPKVEKSVNVPEGFIRLLLTDSEWRMIKSRMQIINLLEDGLSIRKVAATAWVGTDTVVRVARMIEKRNLKKLLNSEKHSKIGFKTSTPWIFGKSD